MSFSSKWLDLRYAADCTARDKTLLKHLSTWARGRDQIELFDLGAGTGSSLSGIQALLPESQRWTLFDYDPALRTAALERLERQDLAGFLRAYETVDLATQIEHIMVQGPDIVLGSALIDLCSAAWIDRLVNALPADTALYMALNYNGYEDWYPAPLYEAEALRAFHVHQQGDKGFGPAMGPSAAAYLAEALRTRGWQVVTADSPWKLSGASRDLIVALADGAASAVAETGVLSRAQHALWHAARRSATKVTIGHMDVLALPAG